jgi:hypothetical protein
MPLKGRFDKLECEYKRLKLVENWNKPAVMKMACHTFFVSAMNLGLACSMQGDQDSLNKLSSRIKGEYGTYKCYLDITDRLAVFLFLYFQRLFIAVYRKYRVNH